MLRIALIRACATDFDEQGRIKGNLDLPLNDHGLEQAAQMAEELESIGVCAIYCSPCQAAERTAAALGQRIRIRPRTLENLANVDHGLWHGRLIEEVRQTQPRVYRQLQERPETICPPNGEPLVEAEQRVRITFDKLIRKHPVGVVAIVVPEPLTSMIRSYLEDTDLGDLWKVECECGGWEMIQVEPEKLASV
jgi:broad specificity phosphatase PhoE